MAVESSPRGSSWPSSLHAGRCSSCARSACRQERAAWLPIGAGLLFYALGSTVYNLELAAGSDVGFPSLADALWLALCPLSLAGMVALVRARHVQVNASLWVDALIGGSVVAAVAAVFVLHTGAGSTGEDWAAVAHLAYPLGDLLLMGFAVVLWGAGGWRFDAWFGLAAGLRADRHERRRLRRRAGGRGLDARARPPTSATPSACCCSPARRGAHAAGPRRPPAGGPRRAADRVHRRRLRAGASTRRSAELDPLAVALIRLTLLAVVVRLGLTLWWLSRQRADLEALAASDPLTGLGNYRAFQERLHSEVAAAEDGDAPVSVVVLDLDHFKALNDTFGHAEGDRVLQATAETLSRTVGEEGFVARVGGEEFAIALPGAGEETAVELAERCRAALAALPVRPARRWPARPASRPTRRTRAASPSFCTRRTAPCTGPSARAATACARSIPSTSSRSRSPSSGARSRRCSRLPAAIVPAFQPVMEVATGRVAGYEALARFAPPFDRPPQLWFAPGAPVRPRAGAGGAPPSAPRARSPIGPPAASCRSTSRPPRCSRRRSRRRCRSTSRTS